MSSHGAMYQVTYPWEMTSVNHYIVFTQTEGKIFFNPLSDKCREHLTVAHKMKQVLYRYYLNKANAFVMHSIWVNTVNTDVIMNKEILVFQFQIRKLYTAMLLYSNLQNHKIYTEVPAAPSLFASFHSGLFSSDGSHNAQRLCQSLTNPGCHVDMVPW
jgi:hypothetical protein